MIKSKAIAFVAILVMSALISLPSISKEVVANGPNQQYPEKQNVTLYMYGPGTNWSEPEDHYEFMNTTFPVNETPTKYRHNDTYVDFLDTGARQGTISRWYSEPLEKDIQFNGTIHVTLFARGDINNIHFIIRFYRMDANGEESRIRNYEVTTNEHETLSQSYSERFYGNTTIPSNRNESINKGERFGIEISYEGRGATHIPGVEPPSQENRNVTLCYASKITNKQNTERGPACVAINCNSIEVKVKKSTNNVNKQYMLITTEVYSAFGGPISEGNFTDITAYFINVTGPIEGESFEKAQDQPLDVVYDNSTKITKIYWQWNYGDDNAQSGDYWLNVSIKDKSANWWVGSKSVTYGGPIQEWEVDFSIPREEENVTFKVDDKKVDTLYVGEYAEVWIKTVGKGDSNYYPATIKVRITCTEIGNPDVEVFHNDAYIDIDLGENETYFVWKPSQTGDFNVKVTLDPDNDQPEEIDDVNYDDENNTAWYWGKDGKGELTITDRKSPIAEIDSPKATEIYQTEGNKITLHFDGSSSKSGNDDDIKSWEWELDGTVIGNTKSFDHEFTIEKHNYNVKLTVTNTDDKEDSKLITIIVNSKPDAVINEPLDNQEFGADDEIHFESRSTDNEGDSLTYKWTSNKDGFLSNYERFVTNLSSGEHEIKLEVGDGYGGLDETTITIKVREKNHKPKAKIDSPSSGEKFLQGEQITFDASSSTDEDKEDKDNLTYTWVSDIDDKFGDEKKFVYSQLSPGEHKITLIVEDTHGAKDETSIYIEITTEVPKPEPYIESNGQKSIIVKVEDTVIFSAENSKNKEQIKKYIWDFGDGNIEYTTIPTVTHEYIEEGTYTVILTIEDLEGKIYTDTMTVIVEPKNEGKKEETDWKLIGGVVGGIAVIVIIGIALALRGRGKEWEEEGWEEEEE